MLIVVAQLLMILLVSGGEEVAGLSLRAVHYRLSDGAYGRSCPGIWTLTSVNMGARKWAYGGARGLAGSRETGKRFEKKCSKARPDFKRTVTNLCE